MVSALEQVPVAPSLGVSVSINTDPIYMCYKCKKEISEKEGYLCGEGHICDKCVKTDIPHDAVVIDSENFHCDSLERAKYVLETAVLGENDAIQDLSDSFIVSQQNGRFWFVLTQDEIEPTKFTVKLYAPKEEVATKYLRRLMEECIYNIDRCEYPEEYSAQQEDEDYATEEEMDEYLKNQDPCFMCGEYNYSNVLFDNGRMRIICRDCLPTVTSCHECETLTKHKTPYDAIIARNRLCFDCHYKRPESVQKPLEEHLLVRLEIQSLRRAYFDVLVDYAELCEFTIFDAYHYKSRCHFYDCIKKTSPSAWTAEETLQFCSYRHRQHADELGCHCFNVYDGREYDDEYEEATCRLCNSAHEENVKSRVALRESHMCNGPIVSAISVFEELKMSNVLDESLIDLREFLV
jgi:hypothetical protein